MIDALRGYPEYKDSGVPWVGAIPAGWRVERAKWHFKRMARAVALGAETVTCYRDGTVTLRRKRRATGYTEAVKEIGYQGVQRGDLVIHAMDAFAGAVGVSDADGKCSPVYSICESIGSIDSAFAAILVREMARTEWILALAKGIRERSTDFRFGDFGEQKVPIPPIDEQRAIVRFLDYADRRIRKYIAAKRKLIALLEEQKRAIIDRAVTRGLDPNVRLKDSGVPWIGMVPEHWSRTKLRRVCRSIRDGSHNPPPPVNSPYRILSARNIVDGELVLRPDDRRLSESAFHELERSFTIRNGDVVVASVGATTGKCAVVQLSELVTAQRSLAILRPNSSLIRAGFLELAIQSSAVQDQIKERMTKYAAQPGIYLDELGGLLIPLPSLCEQDAIVASVRERISSLALLRHSAIQELGSLDQLRTRLTSDVVTGKLDVRDAAANLPDEPSDVPDDTALLDDDSAEAHEEQEES